MIEALKRKSEELKVLKNKKEVLEERIEILEEENNEIYDVENVLNEIIRKNNYLKNKAIEKKEDILTTDLKYSFKTYRNVLISLIIALIPTLIMGATNSANLSIFFKYLLLLEGSYISISAVCIISNHFITKSKASNKNLLKYDNEIDSATNEKEANKKTYNSNCSELKELKEELKVILDEINSFSKNAYVEPSIIINNTYEPVQSGIKQIKKIKK